MNRIDSTSVIPLGWVVSGLAAMVSITVLGAFWVSAVNFRLSRIEQALGIPEFHSENVGEKEAHADTRLPKPVHRKHSHHR
jgi:hypothetical protein